ncbi:hypothetical protein DYB37_011285 [Aphanomyces astaci]|uniref:MYND-type domain-containing protein n=1 Tax=Aphanomyces astaci TaxID=112090 RepID=A0A418ED20_APHAT|nr:hypothetical protein DYB37_011285 [Aphanomyces astaci]
MASTCAYCFAPGARRCGLCKILHYCSRPCQLADWKVHAIECTYLAKHLQANPMTPTLLLVIRLLRSEASMAAVQHLVSHLDSHTANKLDDYRAMGMLVLSIMTRMQLKTPVPSLESVMTVFGQLNCNAFTVCTPEQVPVGIGMFPDAALLNHSCAPNCILVFHKRQLSIRAIRDVAVGDELTVCRMSPLSDHTFADETECSGDAVLSQLLRLHAQADSLEQSRNTRGAVDCRLQAVALARHAAVATPSDVRHAITAYRHVLANQSRLYSTFHMQAFQGLCQLKYARLLHQYPDDDDAVASLREACRMYDPLHLMIFHVVMLSCRLTLSHGDDCPLVQDAIALLHDTQRDQHVRRSSSMG